jgi:molecular chaperone DnaK
MSIVIGIDLGTTNTAVAVLVDGRPQVIEDKKAYKVLPSIVWIGDSGEVITGMEAKKLLLTDPGRTAYSFKRLIGRHFDSEEVQEARTRVGYEIDAAADGTATVRLDSGTVSPVDLSARVLMMAKEMAERVLGETVDEAVVTVPAYFNHAQRAKTMQAIKLAGLNCERLLNEPTAAALAYGYRRDVEKTLLVFDLGGGTFDVSVMRVSEGVYEILSTLGDTYLGGVDFDHRVVDYLAEKFQVAHNIDLRLDRATLHRLTDASERAKCELSFTEQTNVLVRSIADGQNLEYELDRTTLEDLVQDLVARSLQVARQAVADAGLQTSEIDDVILVGGQTRMPMIRSAITDAFGKAPSRSVHPEEVVAIGAAVHAASIAADAEVAPTVLIDVTPFDLGIDVAGGMFQSIIQRNSTIPAAAARVFATNQSQQTSVRITVRQGASRMARENEFLGEFIMTGLTPAPRMETKVEVNFKIDANGMLHVTAMEPATGKRTEITVRNYAEVADSKGLVMPAVRGESAVEQGGELPGHEPRRGRDAGAARPGPSPADKKKRRTKKRDAPKRDKAEKSAGEGGLLGALFGRLAKKKGVPVPPIPTAAPEPSIIEAVAAERMAAAAIPDVAAPEEPPPSPAPAPPEEPDPFADTSRIVLPDLDPDDMTDLGPDFVDSFTEEVSLRAAETILPEPPVAAPDEAEPMELGAEDVAAIEDIPVDDSGVEDDPFATEDLGLEALPEEALPEEAPPEELLPEDTAPFDAGDIPVEPLPAESPDTAPVTGFGVTPESTPEPPPETPPPTDAADKKPARLKLSYRRPEAVVREYRANLERGGCFVKTTKPLSVGRRCFIEVRVPGLDDAIVIPGVVTWSSRDEDGIEPGQDLGMGIEYQIDGNERRRIESILDGLAG